MGLALAGAISAGAYTAGVIDFLVQALEEWEKARGQPGVAQHRAGLKVITGASAGAITGALGVVALTRDAVQSKLTADEVATSYVEPGRIYQTRRHPA
jgi:predicted acylesterase/phospholipase RssA